MKKTRILAMILALVMAVTLFAGCGKKSEETSSVYSEYSVPEVSATTVLKAEKWTAEHGEVSGWVFSNIADYVFYATEDVDNDSSAYMRFLEKLKDGRTLDDVMNEYIADINTNLYYNTQEWIIETPQKITFGGKESYKISVNYSVQTRAARHYQIIFTQLDDEVFMFDSDYTIREDTRDETAINNLISSVNFVPMA
ncbi:MAG TPA: hypothetical protein PK854_06885 [Oscillospiraceae bacterium]|nr:hypothetical protein [Oscillospiraceae bacterium]HPS34973.1 hypothetical protein [Oscillospiraceae bacterium]